MGGYLFVALTVLYFPHLGGIARTHQYVNVMFINQHMYTSNVYFRVISAVSERNLSSALRCWIWWKGLKGDSPNHLLKHYLYIKKRKHDILTAYYFWMVQHNPEDFIMSIINLINVTFYFVIFEAILHYYSSENVTVL